MSYLVHDKEATYAFINCKQDLKNIWNINYACEMANCIF